MSTIDKSQFITYTNEIVEKLDDISDLSRHDIRRYVEKCMNLNKGDLISYEEELMLLVNDAAVAKSERIAKENLEKGEDAPVYPDEADKILEDIINSNEDSDSDDFRDGETPDIEPRRIPCSFYFYMESKLRKEWKERKYDSLYAFAKKMKQKWQLISETKRAKYDRKREKDINRYKKAVIEWRKEFYRASFCYDDNFRKNHLIPPCLHRTDYYYIFRWNEYLEKYPKSHRNIMMGELQEEWNALSQEERYPFEILAEEDEKQFKTAMKKVDSNFDETSRRIHKRLSELDKGHYRPPLFYYIYFNISVAQKKHSELQRNDVVVLLYKKWKELADVKKEKYIQLSKEYTKIPLTLQRQEKEKIRMRYSSKHDNPRDFYYMMNRRYERDLTPYESNKVIIYRLQQQWNNCTNEQREPYEVICAEDLQHYKELLQDEGEKQKIMEYRIKNVRNLTGYNRPALFYYLLLKTDEEMKKDITQDSQQVTLAFYAKWNNLSQEEKKEYEEMSKKYATSKEGTIINNANIDGQSFFSLIHLRYIWLENPEWSTDECIKNVIQQWKVLLPNERKPYEDCSRQDRDRFDRLSQPVTSSTIDKDKKTVQRQEVWRPALFFYLQDQYKEEATKTRAETVTSLYNQWKELSLEQKQPYLDQSNAITKQISEIRASFPFSCYCALFKLFEQKKNPKLKAAELNAIMKKEYDDLSLVDREPYEVMKKEAKDRLQHFLQENPAKVPAKTINVKRVAERNYCNALLPALKKQRKGEKEKDLREELRKQWNKLPEEEQEKWKKQAKEDFEKKNEELNKNDNCSEAELKKLLRCQKHLAAFIRLLTHYEIKAKKEGGKECDDPWNKEQKWYFSRIIDEDVKRYRNDVTLVNEGKRDILSRMRKYAKVLVANNQINQYIKMAVQKCMKSTIRNEVDAWCEADERCRNIAYMTLCHRFDRTEVRIKELTLLDESEVDIANEMKMMDEECEGFCNYLVDISSDKQKWEDDESIYDEWIKLPQKKKAEYYNKQ